MAPNYNVTWAEAPCVACCVQLTHDIARCSRCEGNFLLVLCQTTPWHGSTAMASTSIQRFVRFVGCMYQEPEKSSEGSKLVYFSNSAILRPCQALNLP